MSEPGELKVAVVGAGLMGHGIAQVFGAAGAEVAVFDPDDSTLATLSSRIEANLASLGQAAPEIVARIEGVGSTAEAVVGADLVIEAAPEDLELKRRIFAELDRMTPVETVLASNSSVISISEIAGATTNPQRVLGTHWWNPPYLVPLVEVVQTESTAPAVVKRARALLAGAGKTPVHVRRDVPGFIGNRLQHALWREALAIVDAGICDAETVDVVVRESFGRRLGVLGPIENADLVGLDLTEAIHAYLLPHLDRSTEPARGLRERVAHQQLGAKTGHGYLDWPDGAAEAVRERLVAQLGRSPEARSR